jgi:hypothetical protein
MAQIVDIPDDPKKQTSQKSYNYSDLKDKTHTSNSPIDESYVNGRDTILKDIDTDQEKLKTDYKHHDTKLQTVSEAMSGSKH